MTIVTKLIALGKYKIMLSLTDRVSKELFYTGRYDLSQLTVQTSSVFRRHLVKCHIFFRTLLFAL